MKASSDTEPERLIQSKGKTHFNFNIKEVTVENPDGTTRTAYQYEYVEIIGKVTKSKILKALEDTKLDIDEDYEPAELETQYEDAKEAIKLSNLSEMTYAQLDTYITNNVTDLASAKTYLKKLSKVVLAILKYQNVS